MTQTIRWGMIGAGNVTEVKSGPGFQKAQHSALVAVMRRDAALAKDYAERHGVPRWYDDAEALIRDPDVDAVYIATPPHVHKAYTLLCAEAGKPVYVEKPMALTYAECQEMIAACQVNHVPLWVAYYRRMLPRFLKIKELVDSGAIGVIRSVQVALFRPPAAYNRESLPWRVQPDIAGGGLFVDVGSHTLDLLDYFLGSIHAVTGFAVNQGGLYPAEDHVVANFVFERGVLGSGVWCFTAGYDLDRVELVGTRGKISFATFDNMPVQLVTDAGEQVFTIDHPAHIQQPLIQSIVDELNGEGACPSTGLTAARTSWVIDQILADYRHPNRLG
jgi:predicted dehydrogenase